MKHHIKEHFQQHYSTEQLDIINDLIHAVKYNEFELYYQPQIDLYTGDVVGVEALLRWNHSKKKLICPNSFIGLAESTGMITSIGEWVLYNACKQNKKWQELGFNPFPISINLSVMELLNRDYYKLVKDILSTTGLEPQYLEIELTESSVVKNKTEVSKVFKQLCELGIRVAIDNFGVQCYSLTYLKEIEVDIIKIDPYFVKNILNNSQNAMLLSGIISKLDILGFQVIIEGIETENQKEMITYLVELAGHISDDIINCIEDIGEAVFVKKNSVPRLQGNFFSPPLKCSELEKILI